MSEIQKSSSRKFTCVKCNKNFTKKYHLQTHITSVHLAVKFNCEFCDYQSAQKGNLQTH